MRLDATHGDAAARYPSPNLFCKEMNMAMRNLIPWNRNNNAVPSTFNDRDQDPFLSLHREVNRLFDDVFRSFEVPASFGGFGRGFGAGWPRLEVNDKDDEIVVTAEVPGLTEKDIELLLGNGVLTLRGEKKAHTEDKGRQFSEHFYGRFERRLDIGAEIEQDKVQANFANGMLTVTLPKTERAQSKTRKIPVNVQ